MTDVSASAVLSIAGRYMLFDPIASGGMATVHYGRLRGPVGFARTVAIKRLHAHYANDPEFVSMFVDEARLAARLRHPNVVPTLDVIAERGELLLVMEYVQGETLGRLLKTAILRGEQVPAHVAVAIVSSVLHGLHAAHEARSEQDEPLEIVHRDVSPQNIIVGADGVARLLDFGVAKAAGRLQTTQDGRVKGKLGYMAPEQLRGEKVTRRTDVYAASVVLWEFLTSRRLFSGDSEGEVVQAVLVGAVPPPSKHAPALRAQLDAITLRGLDPDPACRYATAEEMALALERSLRPALPSEVGAWVKATAGEELARRAGRVAAIERGSSSMEPPDVPVSSLRAKAIPAEADATRSQISSISVTTGSRPRGGRTGVRFTIGALLTAFTVAAAMVWTHRRETLRGDVAVAPAASPPSTALEVPSSSATGEPSAASPTSPPTMSTAAASNANNVTAKPSGRATGGKAAPARPAAAASAKDQCNPPYTVDGAGHIAFKRECLH